MVVLEMVVNQKRFVDEDPSGFQGLQDRGKERTKEIEKYDNAVIFLLAKTGWGLRVAFQVYGLREQIRQTAFVGRARKGTQGICVPVKSDHLIPASRQVQCMSALSGRHVQDFPLRNHVDIGGQERGRGQ